MASALHCLACINSVAPISLSIVVSLLIMLALFLLSLCLTSHRHCHQAKPSSSSTTVPPISKVMQILCILIMN